MNYFFFHHPCSDGMMAATIAHQSLSPNVTLIESPPGKPPITLPQFNKGDSIYILDTCFAPQILSSWADQIGKSVIVLDHHEYSKDWIPKGSLSVHDSNRSGCRIAWDYFYPDSPVPSVVKYIEDRDLWRWNNLPQSKIFDDYFYTLVPIDLKSYQPYIFGSNVDQLIDEAIVKGRALGEYIQKQIDDIAKTTSIIQWMGHVTAVVNSSVHISELADYILTHDPEVELVIVWYKNEAIGKNKVSLRSKLRDDGSVSADVNSIALQFGGGGHKTASGFICKNIFRLLMDHSSKFDVTDQSIE